MKRIIKISLIFILLSILNLNAQINKVPIGLKAGLNYSKYIGEIHEVFNAEYTRKIGYQIGLFTEIKLKNKIYLKPELFYSLRGSEILFKDIQSQMDEERWRVNEKTISLPILLQYKITSKINLEIGPQFSSILKSEQEITASANENNIGVNIPYDGYDKFDLSILLGVGINLNEKFTITSSLVNGIIERDTRKIKTSSINLGIEYKL